jgi:hypothetical protein
VRDFRQLVRTSTGSSVALWVSFLQPYSSGAEELWSEYFPVTVSSPTEALNFLLTFRGVRWQARLSNPAGTPLLGKVELTHAPVSFSPSGSGSSVPIGPSTGRVVTVWHSLTATMTLFSPSGGGSGTGTARLLDATSGVQVATVPLNTGDTTLDLSGVAVAQHQSLRVVFDLQSADGQATPRVQAFKVLYDSAVPVPPPPPPVLTLVALPKTVVYGKAVTLSGTMTQSGVPLAGQAVALGAQPVGTTVFTALPVATTDAAGNYKALIKPTKRTTFKAGFTGVSPEPTVIVAVKHSITLKGRRRSGKVYLQGTVGPRHVRRVVRIQRRTGKRWVTIAKVRTSRKSTFKLVRKATAKRAKFRALIGADKEHLKNTSRVVRA